VRFGLDVGEQGLKKVPSAHLGQEASPCPGPAGIQLFLSPGGLGSSTAAVRRDL